MITEVLKYASPETVISFRFAFYEFQAAHPGQVVTVSELAVSGLYTTLGFNTYDSKIAYFGLSVIQTANTGLAGTGRHYFQTYDLANNPVTQYSKMAAVFNVSTTAVNYIPKDNEVKNIFFSRLAFTGTSDIKFIGFKFTSPV